MPRAIGHGQSQDVPVNSGLPLVGLIVRAEDHRWSSDRAHGLGEVDPLVDRLALYDELAPHARQRQQLWARKVYAPLEEQTLAAIRRSNLAGLPYGGRA